ncbi:MAG TPA: hypothetical protein VEQ60_18235 [Longimicrobium sp.]|nr:hypothetical protein [Longimicrobium sp.]
MMKRTLLSMLAAACAAAAPTTAPAQAFGPSADVSAGMFVGGGGTFAERGGPALDGIVALPLGRTRSGTLVAGVTGGISGPLMIGDQGCRIGPNDTCMPDYPVFVTVGAVAGVQRAIGSGLSARVLAGPAYFQATDGDDTFGAQGRLDVAKPLIFRTALVASLRGSLLPRYQGETLSYATFGLGLRIQ